MHYQKQFLRNIYIRYLLFSLFFLFGYQQMIFSMGRNDQKTFFAGYLYPEEKSKIEEILQETKKSSEKSHEPKEFSAENHISLGSFYSDNESSAHLDFSSDEEVSQTTDISTNLDDELQFFMEDLELDEEFKKAKLADEDLDFF